MKAADILDGTQDNLHRVSVGRGKVSSLSYCVDDYYWLRCKAEEPKAAVLSLFDGILPAVKNRFRVDSRG